MKKSIAESKKYFSPKAAMPRLWWVVLASVHSMTEQRIQTTYPNICRFMQCQLSSSRLYGMAAKGLLVKDKNTNVIYGLTDFAYELLDEYAQCVTCEQDAKALGFYSQSLQINMLIRGVSA